MVLQGSTVMRQSSAETLVPEEPYALIAHVRICGGDGWVTAGPTRKPTANSVRSSLAPVVSGGSPLALAVRRLATYEMRENRSAFAVFEYRNERQQRR